MFFCELGSAPFENDGVKHDLEYAILQKDEEIERLQHELGCLRDQGSELINAFEEAMDTLKDRDAHISRLDSVVLQNHNFDCFFS